MSDSLYHPVKIGSLELSGNLFLAPVAGYTDHAFRSICAEYGADFSFTELASAEALVRGGKATFDLIRRGENEKRYAVQLFGHDPQTMYKAALALLPFHPEAVDINCGCPVPKVIKTGAGSALMKNLLVGTPYYYTSNASGGSALFLSLLLPEDQADLLTVLLRTVIELVQGNKDTREAIVSMLSNMIIKDGNFGSTSLHWGIHFILWCMRICGTEITLEKIQRLINLLSWFMPVIRWILRLFGVVK